MATDLERLVVSLDADITRLTRQLQKGGVALDDFSKTADRKASDAKKAINKHLSPSSGGDGLNVIQFQEFSAAARHSFDAIVAGASPLKVLATEGVKVSAAIGPDGVGGLAKKLGVSLSGVLTPARLAAGGLLGIGAAALYSYESYQDAQREIKLGISGVGAASHATVGDIESIATAVSDTSRISVSSARGIATALAATGKVNVSQISGIANLAKGFGALTGKSTEDAGRDLAKIFSDPAKGAETLNERLGVLDGATLHYIQTLTAAGNTQLANDVLLRAVQPAITKAAENVGLLASAYERLKGVAGRGFEAVGAGITAVVDPTAEARLEALKQRRANANQQQIPDLSFGDAGIGDTAAIDAQIKDLEQKIADAKKVSDRAADRTAAVVRSNEATPAIREADPTAVAIDDLTGKLAKLKLAIADAKNGFALPEGGFEHAEASAAALDERLKQLKQDYAAGGAGAAAALRAANFQAATAGLSAYARGLAEINFQYDEAARKARTAANSGEALATLGAETAAKKAALTTQFQDTPSNYAHSVNQVPEAYRAAVLASAQRNAVDPNLLASLLFKENASFDPRAKSPAGALGLGQLLPGTAKSVGVSDPFNGEQSIEGAAKYLSQQLATFQQDEAKALAAYNAGPGRVAAAIKSGGGLASLPKETRDYVPAILQRTPDFKQQADTSRTQDRALSSAKQSYADLAQNLGKSNRALTEAEEIQRQENEAIASGLPLSDALKTQIRERAAAYADLAQKTASVKLGSSLEFERAQLGRTPDQQQIASQLRGAGIDAGSAEEKAITPTLERLHELQDVKSTTGSFTKGLVSDLIQGTTAGKALENQLQRILGKLADNAVDGLISSLFKGVLGGGGAGASSGIFGLLGGVLKLAGGGRVAGAGSSNSDSIPAMLSHGEFVVNAASAAKNAGLLRLINKGGVLRLAAGGPVGSLPAIPSAVVPAGVSGGRAINMTVDARGAQGNSEIQGLIAAGVQQGMKTVHKDITGNIGSYYAKWNGRSKISG